MLTCISLPFTLDFSTLGFILKVHWILSQTPFSKVISMVCPVVQYLLHFTLFCSGSFTTIWWTMYWLLEDPFIPMPQVLVQHKPCDILRLCITESVLTQPPGFSSELPYASAQWDFPSHTQRLIHSLTQSLTSSHCSSVSSLCWLVSAFQKQLAISPWSVEQLVCAISNIPPPPPPPQKNTFGKASTASLSLFLTSRKSLGHGFN